MIITDLFITLKTSPCSLELISQPFSSVFLSQQISISISRFYSQPNRVMQFDALDGYVLEIHISVYLHEIWIAAIILNI
jgi:hypothetical protein